MLAEQPLLAQMPMLAERQRDLLPECRPEALCAARVVASAATQASLAVWENQLLSWAFPFLGLGRLWLALLQRWGLQGSLL